MANLDPNDDFPRMKCWKEITEILSENIEESVKFFKEECTDEEYYWIGEVFDDVIAETQSKELLDAMKERLNKVNPETYDQKSFKSEFMREKITYEEYVKDCLIDLKYAERSLSEE